DGSTLAQLIQANGPPPESTVAAWGIQLLDVLQAAHDLGIVHRDIKPANIMITAANQVKLTDFGIAHTVGDPRLTHTGTMGTQAYMAPELFNAKPITPAADLWSLGATLYHAAHGHGPFDRETTEAILRAILIDDIPAPHCTPGLSQAISALLRRDPAQRATIPQARAQLLAATETPPDTTAKSPPPARPPSRPTQPPPHPTQPPSGPDMAARPDTHARPAADTRAFTNMPNPFVRGLVRFGWIIALVIFLWSLPNRAPGLGGTMILVLASYPIISRADPVTVVCPDAQPPGPDGRTRISHQAARENGEYPLGPAYPNRHYETKIQALPVRMGSCHRSRARKVGAPVSAGVSSVPGRCDPGRDPAALSHGCHRAGMETAMNQDKRSGCRALPLHVLTSLEGSST
ncbi:MAG: serine/threonine-protein kinase, partial [Streptosporangiaceae bacterium]